MYAYKVCDRYVQVLLYYCYFERHIFQDGHARTSPPRVSFAKQEERKLIANLGGDVEVSWESTHTTILQVLVLNPINTDVRDVVPSFLFFAVHLSQHKMM